MNKKRGDIKRIYKNYMEHLEHEHPHLFRKWKDQVDWYV